MEKSKKSVRRILAVVLALVLTCAGAISAFAIVEGHEEWERQGTNIILKDPVDMYWWSYQGYNKAEKGPFSISQATLVKDGTETPVYFVAIAGFENIGNGNDKNATYLAAFNLNNGYTERVKKVMLANIPQGSNVFLLGDSLGGYVAQQIAADSDIQYNYNIIHTTTIGAPEMAAGRKEGTESRIMDKNDIVPNFMGLDNYTRPLHSRDNAVIGDSGYGLPTAYAHASYSNKQTWGSYDVMGRKNGDAKLIVDSTTTKFYRVPYDSSLSFISQEQEIKDGKEDDPNNVAFSYGE